MILSEKKRKEKLLRFASQYFVSTVGQSAKRQLSLKKKKKSKKKFRRGHTGHFYNVSLPIHRIFQINQSTSRYPSPSHFKTPYS